MVNKDFKSFSLENKEIWFLMQEDIEILEHLAGYIETGFFLTRLFYLTINS